MTISPAGMLEAVFEHGGIAMAILDEHDEIVATNPAFERLLGYDADALAGTSFAAIGDIRTHPESTGTFDAGLRRGNGEISDYRVTVARRVDGQAGGTLVLVEDPRLHREAEADRQRREARDRMAHKMEAVGQLSGGIAHDFNNMLTVILANAELIAGTLGRHDSIRADLEELRAAARRGTVMVRKLLGFSRRERLVLRPVNLGRLVEELSTHLRQGLPDRVHLEVIAEPSLDVSVDPNAVEQILSNLLSNARDAMPDGGKVTIRTAAERLDAEHARRHGWGEPGDYVSLSVTDTGVGMDERVLSRLFEPFFTTKPPGLGTGLGMAMIYGLVKQHGGFILVESQPGTGTTVRIYLRPAMAGPAQVSAVSETIPRGGNELVLLVEDEEPIRRTTRRVLERFGYRVLVAADGVEALKIIRQRKNDIDLVISDVIMPNLGGKGLYDAARAEGATMKFLFASGYTARDVGATGVIDSQLPFIHKPWTVADFARRVREVLDR